MAFHGGDPVSRSRGHRQGHRSVRLHPRATVCLPDRIGLNAYLIERLRRARARLRSCRRVGIGLVLALSGRCPTRARDSSGHSRLAALVMGGAARCLLLCPWAERQASCTIGDDRFVPNTDGRQVLLSRERLRKYTPVPYRNPACIKLFARATIRSDAHAGKTKQSGDCRTMGRRLKGINVKA